MNRSHHEEQLLSRLFEEDAPQYDLLDPPSGLQEKLYRISETSVTKTTGYKRVKQIGAVAAIVLIGILGVNVHQQYQVNQALQQVNADLLTTLHYLQKANRVSEVHFNQTIQGNMQKAAVEPIIDSTVIVPAKHIAL